MRKGDLWRHVRQYKFNSIFIKNLLVSMLMVSLPLAIISAFIYRNNNSIVEYEAETYGSRTLSQTAAVMTTVLGGADRIAADLLVDDNVKVFITSPEYNVLNPDSYSNIKMLVSSFSNSYKAIESVYVYSQKNKFVISNQEVTGSQELFPDNTWLSLYDSLQWKNEATVVSRRYGNIYPYFISIIHTAYMNEKSGAVIVNLNVEKLLSMTAFDKANEEIYVVDSSGTILLSGDLKQVGKSRGEIPALNNLKDNTSVIRQLSGSKYVVSTMTSSYNNLKFISLTPVDDFRERAGGLQRFWLVVLAGGLLLSLLIAFYLSIRSYRPLQNILAVLENKGDVAQPGREDERAGDGGEVKYILSNIAKSINTTKEQELELKSRLELLNKAQVAALLAQINPHFVHNTLETINIKAVRLGGYDNEVSQMVTDLSGLLRLSLESDTHLSTVGEEAVHVKLYRRIMEQRFSGRFAVEWGIDPEIMDCKIVKICLQPVVENAISHGMKPLKRLCHISIRGWREENGLILEVKDDGAGMPPERLESLRQGLGEIYSIKGRSVGLGNVNQRIKLIFGEQYGISVESEEGTGTTVRLKFPYEASRP